MALGLLFLLFVVMMIIALLGTTLLFLTKNKNINDVILVTMTAYSLVIAYLGAMGQPSNFVAQQLLCWGIGLVAVVGTGLRFALKKQLLISKVLVILSILSGLFSTFLL